MKKGIVLDLKDETTSHETFESYKQMVLNDTALYEDSLYMKGDIVHMRSCHTGNDTYLPAFTKFQEARDYLFEKAEDYQESYMFFKSEKEYEEYKQECQDNA